MSDSALFSLATTYRGWVAEEGFFRMILHASQVPLLLSVILLMCGYIIHFILALTPIGIALNTEIIWTTFLSPFLIAGYPIAMYNILGGSNTQCMKLSDMAKNTENYSGMDFVTQLALKENRLTAPVVLGPSVFFKSVFSFYGYSFESKYLVAAEQLMSWVRLPFVWVSWLIFAPSYLMTIGVDILVLMVYLVLTQTETADVRNLELYAYDMFGTACIVQNEKCPEFWVYYDSHSDSCKNFCDGETLVYGE